MLMFEDLGIKTKSGKVRYATICPECDSKRTRHKGALCLTVNDEPGNRWYRCNHCGWSGNLDVQDHYDRVHKESRMPSKERQLTMKVRAYLEGRGFSLATIKKCRVYEMTSNGDAYVCFPYFMNLTLVNVKFKNIDWTPGSKTPKVFQLPQSLGTRIIPWNLQNINFDDPENKKEPRIVIITEGEPDTMTWVECGYDNTISVPQGAPSVTAKVFTKEFAWLEDKFVKSVFADVDLFYLSIDEDEAGRLLRKHLAMLLGKDRCRIIRYPPGYKDINEVLAGNRNKNLPPLGKQGVIDCYNNISSVPVAGVLRLHMVLDDLDKIRNNGFIPGLGCGVSEVDRLFTVKPKLITFVTGVPGAGKSVWIRWWLTEMIKHNEKEDLRWAMFTPENRPVAREYAKIIEAATGMNIRKGLGENSLSDEAFRTTKRWVEKHFFVISPDRKNFERWDGDKSRADKVNTLDNILKYLEYLKKTENIFGYVIDAWNKIEHEQPKWQQETTFISEQLDRLIAFNDYWDLHGIIIVHPRKIEQVGENYKMPSLYDIKGSSAWKEKADIGILIHRYKLKKISSEAARRQGLALADMDEDEKWYVVPNAPTIIRTEKIRFEEIGVEDRVRMIMKTGGRFVLDASKKLFDPRKDEEFKEENERQKSVPSPGPTFTFYEKEDDDTLPF